MRIFIPILAAAAAAFGAQAASAQDLTTSFRGFRLEGNAGGDRFQSQGNHKDKFGFGGTFGFDGQVGDKIVIGAEGSFWKANHWSENVTTYADGTVRHKSFEEYGAAVRAGYLVTPGLLMFGKGGFVSTDQRKSFTPSGNNPGYYNHTGTDGYQLGGGVEFSVTQFNLPLPVYVSAQYVYSNYDDHTSRQRLMGGIGVRFK